MDTLEDDLEVKIIKEERADFLKGIPGLLVLLACMTFSGGTRTCGLASIVLTAVGASPMYLMNFGTGRASVIRQSEYALMSGAIIRTAVHLLWIAFHPRHEFMKLLCLVAFPISLARQHNNKKTYIAYLAVHNLLSVYRSIGDFQANLPCIAVVIIMSLLGMEFVTQKGRGVEMRHQLHATLKQMAILSETTVRSLLDSFCDAVVVLGPDLDLLDSSPDLTALLGRQADKGKSFDSFVDMGDREELRNRVTPFLQSDGDSAPHVMEIGEEAKLKNSMELQSLRIHLQDAYGGLVGVHLFHVCHKCPNQDSLLYVGISEVWQPRAKCRAKTPRKKEVFKLCMETGQIMSTAPAFPTEKGMGLDFKLRDVSISSQRRRTDSPRPPKRA